MYRNTLVTARAVLSDYTIDLLRLPDIVPWRQQPEHFHRATPLCPRPARPYGLRWLSIAFVQHREDDRDDGSR
jgi:hypothetical protein